MIGVFFCTHFLINFNERIDIIMRTQGKIRVYKRKNKSGYSYTYSIEAGTDLDGKRKRKSKSGFKTEREARIAGNRLLNSLLLGNNILESNITFKDYADEWLNNKNDVKKGSLSVLKYVIKTANSYLGNYKMKNITLYQYECFLNDFAQNHSSSSLNTLDIYIRQIFASAKKYGIISNNPTLEAVKPKITPKNEKNITDKYLTKSEIFHFLDTAKQKTQKKHHYFYYYCVLLTYTGLRIGEASALIWDNIDFNNKTLTVEATLFYGKKPYTRQLSPKTDTSRRIIMLDDTTIKLLKEWKSLQLQLRLKYGTRGTEDNINYVFTNMNITQRCEMPVSNNSISCLMKNTAKTAGIQKHIHPHIFRHTHASLLAEASIPLEVISKRLGHSTSEITKKIYLHITQSLEKRAVETFSQYMQKASTF